jgi:hypothetical protein
VELHVPVLTVLPHCVGVCRGTKAAQGVNNETILLRIEIYNQLNAQFFYLFNNNIIS